MSVETRNLLFVLISAYYSGMITELNVAINLYAIVSLWFVSKGYLEIHDDRTCPDLYRETGCHGMPESLHYFKILDIVNW